MFNLIFSILVKPLIFGVLLGAAVSSLGGNGFVMLGSFLGGAVFFWGLWQQSNMLRLIDRLEVIEDQISILKYRDKTHEMEALSDWDEGRR